MEVIGYNVSPQEIWDNITNIRPYNKRSKEQYIDTVLKPNQSAINAISSYPLEGALRIVNSQNQESVFQTLGALPQWQKAKTIAEGSGEVIVWDLETIGDIAHQVSKYDGYATITEFGIGRRVYENGALNTDLSNAVSFAFGTNQQQTLAIKSLISKYEKSGWDALTNAEQVTLDRVSKIGSLPTFHDVFFSRNDTVLGDGHYWTVNRLGESSMNPAIMKIGADRLQTLYNSGARPEAIIPQLTAYINNAVGSNTSALAGANNIFDITALEQTSRRLEVNQGVNFRHIYENTIDAVNAVRTMATAKGQSVLSFTDAMHGIIPSDTDRPASVESIMESLRMNRSQLHIGSEDTVNEGDIIFTRHYNGNKSFIDSLLEMTGNGDAIGAYNVDLNGSLFLMNRGYIDQSTSDMAVIAGDPIPQSYSMGNEYWRVNTEKTGFASVIDGSTGEAQEKFILSFINPADKSIEIHKEFETPDKAIEFLRKNTTWISDSAVTQKQINEQHVMGYLDKGRREYAKFFDPLSVRANKGTDEYGFEGLKRYLSFVEELDGLEDFANKKARPALVSRLHGVSNSPLRSTYQEQAFAGMFERLSQEKDILSYIVNQIDSTMGNANNVTKTIALQKAYDSTMDYLTSQYIAFTPKEAHYGLSDVFGIDVQVGNELKRINAQSVDSAIPGLRNIFNGMTAQEAGSVVENLAARSLITAEQVTSLKHSIDLSFQPNAGINGFLVDVASQLVGITDRFNTSSNAIDEYRQILADGSDIRIANKNLQSIVDNLLTGAQSRYRYQSGEKFYQASSLFGQKAVREAIEDRITQSLSDVTSMSFYTGTMHDGVSNKIARKLNLSTDEKTIVEEMFSSHYKKNGKSYYAPYAINSPENVKKGLQSFVLLPENSSNAFVVLTNKKHSNSVVQILSGLNDDVDYHTLSSALEGHGAVEELYGINKTSLGDSMPEAIHGITGNTATLTSINQGRIEKFLNPIFDVYSKNGKVSAMIKSGAEDLLVAHRIAGGKAIEFVLNDEFEKAQSAIRRTQNAKLKELSSPSSYRGYVTANGVERIANYHPADFLHAYEMNVTGLKTLIGEIAETYSESGFNPIQQMLYIFNEQQHIVSADLREAKNVTQFRAITESNAFNEFFVKNLFHGSVMRDSAMQISSYIPDDIGYTPESFDKSIFRLMQDAVAMDSDNKRYTKSVAEALSSFEGAIPYINQLLPESAINHGLISFIKPGAFNNLAGLFSTMRPTYTQQNRPMYFGLGEIDVKALEGEIVDDPLKSGYIMARPTSLTPTEYSIRQQLGKTTLTPDGLPFDTQQRAITTRFKQISDIDLQLKYRDAEKNIESIAQALGLDVDKARATLQYMREDLSSVYEGKWFLDPLLGNQDFFQSPDAKKVSFNINNIDEQKTRKILGNLAYKDLDSNTVIAVTESGQSIYYRGPKAKFSLENIEELLEQGSTYVIPEHASISDVKTMIGSEKATAHTISMKPFMSYTGISTQKEAMEYAHGMFQYIFDNASVAGNIAASKHNNNYASWSTWYTIEAEYAKFGKLDNLRNIIQDKSNGLYKYFQDWTLDIADNGQTFIVDNTNAAHMVEAITALEKYITTHTDGNVINSRIAKLLQYNRENNIIYGPLQRVHMNEHLSNMFRMDQRLEQSIRIRNKEYLSGGTDGIIDGVNGRIVGGSGRSWDDLYVDATKEYAMSKDVGKGIGFLSDDLGAIQELADAISKNNISEIRRYNRGVLANQDSIRGIVEASAYYANPASFNPKEYNIVTVTMQDLMNGKNVPKNARVKDLQDFIFDIDGKPAAWLEALAKRQNVELTDAKSYSIFFDFGEEITIGKGKDTKTYRGALIPRQNVTTHLDDSQFLMDQHRNITRFFNEMIEAAKNPSMRGKMSEYYKNFAQQLYSEIAIMKKDSDMYKAFGRYALPNSGQFLAQDETPAIIDSMLSDDVQKLIAERDSVRQAIHNGEDSLENINKLSKLDAEIRTKLSRIADSEVRNADTLSPLSSIQNRTLRDASIVTIDGKQYYNNAVAIGEQGFKDLGFDFGKAGMDIVADFEGSTKGKYSIPGMDRFSIMPSEVKDVVDRINALDIDGIHIADSDLLENGGAGITKTLNRQITELYGDTGTGSSMLDIRDVNRGIANGSLTSIFGTFEEIGKKYVETVGLLGEHLRYPVFGGQPAVNVLLDRTIQDRQIRFLNPAMSVYTNVDFDGDTTFLHLVLDGNSMGKIGQDRYDNLLQSYKKSITYGTEIIANMIEEGKAFQKDMLNDTGNALAGMLKSFKEDAYWDAVKAYMDDRGYAYTDVRDIDDAFLDAANHSEFMTGAWERAGFNTLTDADSIKASLTPALRKSNIGAISTPNFNLRETILSFVNDPKFSDELREEYTSILNDMSNMRTETRGLTGITEQKGIDVKHLIDAFNIAETSKWSFGLNQMFSLRDTSAAMKAAGLENMIRASNHVLFKASDDEIKSIIQEIMSTTRSDFDKQISKVDKKTAETIIYKKWFRGLYDISNLEGANVIFNRGINTGSLDDYMRMILDLSHRGEYKGSIYGTIQNAFREAFMDASSDTHILFDKNSLYIRPGDLGDAHDRGYMYAGFEGSGKSKRAMFKEVSLSTLEETGETFSIEGKNIASINSKALDFFGLNKESGAGVNIYEYKNNSQIRAIADSNIAERKIARTLNSLLLGADGSIAKSFDPRFAQIDKMAFNVTSYEYINGLFKGNGQQILDSINEMAQTYQYTTNASGRVSVDALIRQLNADIAKNRDKYANSSIDMLLQERLISASGGAEEWARAVQKRTNVGDFSKKLYDESLDFLNKGLYDIIGEESKLLESFAEIEKYVQAAEELSQGDLVRPLRDTLNTRGSSLGEIRQALQASNSKLIAETQAKIYGLFRDSKQMASVFEWDRVSSTSVVGFGEYMGIQFQSLSPKDVQRIQQSISDIIAEGKATGLYADAVLGTQRALRAYDFRKNSSNSGRIYTASSAEAKQVIAHHRKILADANKVINDANLASKMHQKMQNNMKQNTLRGSFFDAAKEAVSKIPMKTVGITVASLAAIGIANNILHNQKNQSPLTPARRPGGNGEPDMTAPVAQAPASKQRVVYHDKQSGLQFKVSAKTKNYIDDRNNAKLIGMAGGGQSSVYSQSDMSGVTDNWLANKFAELT